MHLIVPQMAEAYCSVAQSECRLLYTRICSSIRERGSQEGTNSAHDGLSVPQCASFYPHTMGVGHATKKDPQNKPHLMYGASPVKHRHLPRNRGRDEDGGTLLGSLDS